MSLLQCVSPQGQTTPERIHGNPFYGKGFCEPSQYKSAIHRCEGGCKSLELGIEMYKDLVKIFEDHTAALHRWLETNEKNLCQSREIGTTKRAWLDSIRAVDHLGKRSHDIGQNILKNVVTPMVEFKNQQYGKSFIHSKKANEFEKEFKSVQKPWAQLLNKINEAKTAYLNAKKKLENAESHEKACNSDVGSSAEEKRKIKTYAENCRSDRDSCKKHYKNLCDEMEKKKDTYETDMFKILGRADAFEKERLAHLQKGFAALQKSTSIDDDKRHSEMSTAFQAALKLQIIDEDIKYFNTHYGSGTTTKYPVFEE